MPSDDATPKQVGRYEILRLIAEGAMGRVLLAHDPVLDRDVAVKLLRDDLKIPDDVRDGLIVRMRHEARAAARVAHPNLVTLHDMGEDDAVGLYLVFEYLEGPTLKECIKKGRLSPRRAARIARELGAALTFAHRAGVLHRDIKPENVILSATGAKLADFGIARIPDSTLTHAGGLLGTPAYSAPETFRVSKFSAESDQFSLAATLYEAISGRRAFPGDDAVAVASKIATDPPKPFAEKLQLSPSVDTVLLKAMAKAPADRYESCEAFGLALVSALTGLAVPARPASSPFDLVGRGSMPSTSGSDGAATDSQVPTLNQPEKLDLALSAVGDAAHPTLPPPERRTTQIVIGGAVVLITAGLLVHTATQDPETDASLVPALASARSEADPSTRPPAPPPPVSDRGRKAPAVELDAGAQGGVGGEAATEPGDAGAGSADAGPATSPADEVEPDGAGGAPAVGE